MKPLFVLAIMFLVAGSVMGHNVHDRQEHDHDHKEPKEEHDHKEHKEEHDHDHKEHEHKHEHNSEEQHKIKPGDIKNFLNDKIVPDVVDKAPEKSLKVTFDKHEVNQGNELTPTQVKEQPKVTWDAEKDAFYTLAMIDPDAPNRKTPTLRHVKHWLVVNIHGSDLSTGEEVAAFMSSGPPKDSGLHRYVFLLYKQQKKIDKVDEAKSPVNSRENRLKFDIKKFVEKHSLGSPIAGNYYQAQWDEYVEERNKKIKN